MCQALPKELWMDKRREDVLDAPYFHVVFTVPQELNPIIYSNQQLLYDALYHSVLLQAMQINITKQCVKFKASVSFHSLCKPENSAYCSSNE